MKYEINKIGQLKRVSSNNFIYPRILTTYSDTNETENIILNFYLSRHIFNPFLAPAVTVGERRELWILPPFFFGLFFCL